MTDPIRHSEARLGMREVRLLLQGRVRELVPLLCPGGRREGRYWIAPNPRRGEDKAGSFFVWIDGAAAGAWKEADAGDTEKGDIFQLIQYSGQAKDMKEALAWAKAWLGIDKVGAPEIQRLQEQAHKIQHANAIKDAKDRQQAVAYARGLWLEAEKLNPETKTWRYLEDGRGIPLRSLVRTDINGGGLNTLRAHPGLTYHWPPEEKLDPSWRARRPASGKETFPAMIAAFSPAIEGPHAGAHRTWLAHDGLSKANVVASKKMVGQQLGCAIKIWRGETRLSARDAARKGALSTLVLTEGIEDALSCAVSTPQHRVWAVGSLAGLGALPFPPCAKDIVIFADNDWNKPQATAALDAAARRLAQSGEVRIARSPIGKDANDLLKAQPKEKARG